MISDKKALDLFELATGSRIEEMPDEELHLVIDSVRAVRAASSEAEAVSALGWMGHGQEWTIAVAVGLRQEVA